MATALCELSEKISTLAALAFPCNTTTAFAGRGVWYLPIFLQSLLLSKKPRHTGKLDKTLGAPIYLACLVAQSSYSCHSDNPFFARQRNDSEYVTIQFPSLLAWALADPPCSSTSCDSCHHFDFATCSVGVALEIVRDFKFSSSRIPFSS